MVACSSDVLIRTSFITLLFTLYIINDFSRVLCITLMKVFMEVVHKTNKSFNMQKFLSLRTIIPQLFSKPTQYCIRVLICISYYIPFNPSSISFSSSLNIYLLLSHHCLVRTVQYLLLCTSYLIAILPWILCDLHVHFFFQFLSIAPPHLLLVHLKF